MNDYNYSASILNDEGTTNISIPGSKEGGGLKSIGILEPESEEVNQQTRYGKPNRLPESKIH